MKTSQDVTPSWALAVVNATLMEMMEVRHLLKNPPSVLDGFHLISNFPFLGEVLEKVGDLAASEASPGHKGSASFPVEFQTWV